MLLKLSSLLRKIAFDLLDFPAVLQRFRGFIEKSSPDWFEYESRDDLPDYSKKEIEEGIVPDITAPTKAQMYSYPLLLTPKGVIEWNRSFSDHPNLKVEQGKTDLHKRNVLYSISHFVSMFAMFSESLVMDIEDKSKKNQVKGLLKSFYKLWGGYEHMNETNLYHTFRGKSHEAALSSLDTLLKKSLDLFKEITDLSKN